MSEPSPFLSTQEQLYKQEQQQELESQKLGQEQLENEKIFAELNQQRLRELEKEENEKISEETYKEYNIKDKTLQQFFSGFSDSVLGIINDILYKMSNQEDDNFSWGDILTTNDRPFYIGILIIILAVFLIFIKN